MNDQRGFGGSERSPLRTATELRRFFSDRDPTAALDQLAADDRLEMARRCAKWAADRCYLVDVLALTLRTYPMVINDGPELTDTTDLDEWINERIEVAGQALLQEDIELCAADAPLEEPLEPRYRFLASTLGFRMNQLRRAMVAANGLPVAERHVFHNTFSRAEVSVATRRRPA